MAKNKPRKSSADPHIKNQRKSINFWQMVRDVFIASLAKGQFPVAMLGTIFLLVIYKMPSDDVSKLIFEIITDFREKAILSFFISPVLILGWFFHTKWQRKILRNEILRISNERNELQKKLLGNKISSSENNY